MIPPPSLTAGQSEPLPPPAIYSNPLANACVIHEACCVPPPRNLFCECWDVTYADSSPPKMQRCGVHRPPCSYFGHCNTICDGSRDSRRKGGQNHQGSLGRLDWTRWSYEVESMDYKQETPSRLDLCIKEKGEKEGQRTSPHHITPHYSSSVSRASCFVGYLLFRRIHHPYL